MDHCVESQAQHIDENMPFFAVDPLTRVITIGIDARSPFFCAFQALAINDWSGGTRLALAAFAAVKVGPMAHSIQRAVEAPQIQ
jgi:hypothetical protein